RSCPHAGWIVPRFHRPLPEVELGLREATKRSDVGGPLLKPANDSVAPMDLRYQAAAVSQRPGKAFALNRRPGRSNPLDRPEPARPRPTQRQESSGASRPINRRKLERSTHPGRQPNAL